MNRHARLLTIVVALLTAAAACQPATARQVQVEVSTMTPGFAFDPAGQTVEAVQVSEREVVVAIGTVQLTPFVVTVAGTSCAQLAAENTLLDCTEETQIWLDEVAGTEHSGVLDAAGTTTLTLTDGSWRLTAGLDTDDPYCWWSGYEQLVVDSATTAIQFPLGVVCA